MATKKRKTFRPWKEFVAAFMLIAVTIFLVIHFFVTLSFSDSSVYFLDKERLFLAEDTILTQRFIAAENHLSSLGIPIDKSALRPPKGTLVISLKDSTCQKILATEEINLLHIFYSRIQKISFSPLPESKGRQYCFEAIYSLDETQKREGEFINLWRSPSPQFATTFFSDNAQIVKGYSLIFKPYYDTPSAQQSLTRLVQRMSQYKPNIFKGGAIILLSVASFIVSYGVAIILLFRKARR